jgi:sec-independent protein translocase protein TatB
VSPCVLGYLESAVFDLNLWKLLLLGVVALVVFGPDKLPQLASQAGRALRELRKLADGAKAELQENLGPEFSQLKDLDITDLNPKTFVRKHFVSELTGDGPILGDYMNTNGGASGQNQPTGGVVRLAPGERPPFDAEAT